MATRNPIEKKIEEIRAHQIETHSGAAFCLPQLLEAAPSLISVVCQKISLCGMQQSGNQTTGTLAGIAFKHWRTRHTSQHKLYSPEVLSRAIHHLDFTSSCTLNDYPRCIAITRTESALQKASVRESNHFACVYPKCVHPSFHYPCVCFDWPGRKSVDTEGINCLSLWALQYWGGVGGCWIEPD